MVGMDAKVSTLFSTVGFSNRPLWTLRMYFGRGSPTLPSIEFISAVDSPHTKAPPPRTMLKSSLWSLPMMCSPKIPAS